ncbi:MAG: chorismate-binding protein [Maricaulaceae bacterium]|nr:chorismate-binding protein [Maricaulaceae bacterium]
MTALADAAPPSLLPWRAPEDAFSSLADEPWSLLLHGGPASPSYVFAFPDAVFTDDFAAASAAGRAGEGWLAGLMAYELAGAFETLPRPGSGLCGWPDLMLGRYRACAVFDPVAKAARLSGEAGACKALKSALLAPESALSGAGPADWRARWSEAKYLERCAAARAYVLAGDVYQVNLSHAFEAALDPADHPYAVFRRLIAQSPASYGVFLRLPDGRAVVSNSPELFLKLESGVAETRPIKGTRPRGGTPLVDAGLAAALMASEKDRAENLMIVDLMRNDLSRVCIPGSVKTPRLFAVESYSNVHHLVSTVTGELRADADAFDLAAAAFPPGSITGAPKLRAMQIIAELEEEARGPYCGAAGMIGQGGAAMTLNVMIRTLSFVKEGRRWRAEARSGGAITADSDPRAEYAETLAKAAALKRALTGA